MFRKRTAPPPIEQERTLDTSLPLSHGGPTAPYLRLGSYVLMTATVAERPSSALPHTIRRAMLATERGLEGSTAGSAATLESRTNRIAIET